MKREKASSPIIRGRISLSLFPEPVKLYDKRGVFFMEKSCSKRLPFPHIPGVVRVLLLLRLLLPRKEVFSELTSKLLLVYVNLA